MLNMAMLSKWHVHAAGYAKEFQRMEDVNLTCVWDEDPVRGAAWAKDLGVDFEPDLDSILARTDVDAVAVCTPTNMHEQVMVKSANAGKHIFTEKVMALTMAQCRNIEEAVKKNGVKFCISFPWRTMPMCLYVKQVVSEGLLGDVTLLRMRNAHGGATMGWLPEYWYDPATTGGGAMMDLGCHSMYLARWILGKPVRISSMFTNLTGHGVEDNAVCTAEFEKGAIGIIETSLVSPYSKTMFEVYGTEGMLQVVGQDIKVTSKKMTAPFVGEMTPAKLPEKLPTPTRMFAEGVLYGKEIVFGMEEALQLTELMEKAYLSYNTGKEQTF